MHRIHTGQTLEPEINILLQGRSAHYVSRVLRVGRGESFILFNGDGFDYAAEVIRPGKKEILIQVRSRLPGRPESPLQITVVQALSRGERMDLCLQKCTVWLFAACQPRIS